MRVSLSSYHRYTAGNTLEK